MAKPTTRDYGNPIQDAPDPVPDPPAPLTIDPVLGEDILVHLGDGGLAIVKIVDIPGYDFARDGLERRLTLPSFGNVEHCDTHPSGVWVYRSM